jgi:glycosyltransferase involved in cell wall biosynthesis
MLLEINAPLAAERAKFGNLALKRLAARCEKAVWSGADIALPVTRVLADMVAQERGPQGIHVIPNGADLSAMPDPQKVAALRTRLGLQDKVVLGFVGFVRPWHGLEWAIHALPRLADNVHLLVVGDGPAQAALQDDAARLSVAHRVHFAGRIAHDDVSSFVQNFDIALQTRAVGYCSPLKLFEYMALGRAIIAPDQPNLREVLRPEVDALLFNPDDEASFFATLARLSADPELRARLGSAARRSVEETPFTWAENARRVEELAAALVRPN